MGKMHLQLQSLKQLQSSQSSFLCANNQLRLKKGVLDTFKGATILAVSFLSISCTNSLPVVISDRSISKPVTPQVTPAAPSTSSPTVQTANPQDRAIPLADRDINVERAEYYQSLATTDNDSESRAEARLNAAENFIQAGDYYNAELIANSLTGLLTKTQKDRLTIVNAYIDYQRNDFNKSLQTLEPLIGNLIPKTQTVANNDSLSETNDNSDILRSDLALTSQQVDALLLGSFCYQQLGNHDSAIATLIRRENALVGESRSETTRYIWQVIEAIPSFEREQLITTTSNPSVRNRLEQSLQGQVSQNNVAPTQFTQWRDDSSTQQVQSLDSNWSETSPRNIAVLLPLSSKFNKAAQALLDGIKYQNELNASSFRPQIQVYDIGQNPFQVQQFYNAAVSAGADFVIGPLGTEYANQISGLSGQRTPTILLGGDTNVGGSTVRFSMSPEMQGLNAAKRAQLDGHTTAAILTSNTQTNQRIINAFNDYWLQTGGKISSVVHYNENQFDHSTQLKQLFDIGSSESRHNAISNTLGFKPKFNAYQRRDIDFVFMLADNESGRIVRPQINFFSGSKIPVYSTSNIFNGIPNSINNIDLDNTLFPIMPWVFRSSASASYAGQLNRLFAMGADAYEVAGNFQALRSNPDLAINANTGQVSINQNAEVSTQPLWAKFVNGEPKLIETLGIDVSPNVQFSPQSYGSGTSTRSSTEKGVYNDRTWDTGESRRKAGP